MKRAVRSFRKLMIFLILFYLASPCNVMAEDNGATASCSELSIQIVSAFGAFHQYRREAELTGYSRHETFKGQPEKEREYKESVLAADELVRRYRNMQCPPKALDKYLNCLNGSGQEGDCPQILFKNIGTSSIGD